MVDASSVTYLFAFMVVGVASFMQSLTGFGFAIIGVPSWWIVRVAREGSTESNARKAELVELLGLRVLPRQEIEGGDDSRLWHTTWAAVGHHRGVLGG